MLQKKAESLAAELKGLQGELADYNSVVDKMNVNDGVDDIDQEYNELKVSRILLTLEFSPRSGGIMIGISCNNSEFSVELTLSAHVVPQTQNDQEARAVEALFEQRQGNEARIRDLEREIVDARYSIQEGGVMREERSAMELSFPDRNLIG